MFNELSLFIHILLNNEGTLVLLLIYRFLNFTLTNCFT